MKIRNLSKLLLDGLENVKLCNTLNVLEATSGLGVYNPKAIKKNLVKTTSHECDHWDCFIVSYSCTCEGNCDGCSGARN